MAEFRLELPVSVELWSRVWLLVFLGSLRTNVPVFWAERILDDFLSELKTLDDFKSQDCLHMTRCWSKHVKAPQPYFYCVCSWGWIQQLLLSVLQIEHNQAGLPPEAHECVQTCSTRSAS